MLVAANIFQPLIDAFEAVLKFFHGGGISWGFSIVLLTVCVRAVLVPLTLRQLRSMQKLQQLSPQLKAIQAKYKEDKQRQQQEIMKFYKENNVNPLASCLPLLLQLPVFIGLFFTLRKNLRPDICPTVQHAFLAKHTGLTAAVAKSQGTTFCTDPHYATQYHQYAAHHGGAGFLFVPDLTNKATGWVLAVLIVLYVGTQVVSTMMMSAPTMENSQRRLFMLLPLFFVIFVINFPAGLIVYWITTNTWTMVQQYVVRRTMAPPVPVAAGPPTGGGGPTGGPGSDGGAPSNGAGSAGGLGATLRGLLKPPAGQEPTGVGSARPRRESAPPPPPRKKKKRSGRRR
jgi:YidC/Oxa1 family membrane protein insertase